MPPECGFRAPESCHASSGVDVDLQHMGCDVSQRRRTEERLMQHADTAPSPEAREAWSHLLTHLSTRLCLVSHPVPHFKQLFSWDCGLACALMTLRTVGLHHCNYNQLRQLCPTTSIWTIDLAHLLRRFGLDVTFLTVTLGPNPAYHTESFYLANMQEDERRVSELFRNAQSAGIWLSQRSVCWQEIATHLLSGSSLAVVLVDRRKLDPWLVAADMCLPYAFCGMDPGYTGHYILISGWDADAKQFLAHDPSNSEPGMMRLTPAALDAARLAFGTDEDLLFVRHPVLMHTARVVSRTQQPQKQKSVTAPAPQPAAKQSAALQPGAQRQSSVSITAPQRSAQRPASNGTGPATQPSQSDTSSSARTASQGAMSDCWRPLLSSHQSWAQQPWQKLTPWNPHPPPPYSTPGAPSCQWDVIGVPRSLTRTSQAGSGLVSPQQLLPPPPPELLPGLWCIYRPAGAAHPPAAPPIACGTSPGARDCSDIERPQPEVSTDRTTGQPMSQSGASPLVPSNAPQPVPAVPATRQPASAPIAITAPHVSHTRSSSHGGVHGPPAPATATSVSTGLAPGQLLTLARGSPAALPFSASAPATAGKLKADIGPAAACAKSGAAIVSASGTTWSQFWCWAPGWYGFSTVSSCRGGSGSVSSSSSSVSSASQPSSVIDDDLDEPCGVRCEDNPGREGIEVTVA